MRRTELPAITLIVPTRNRLDTLKATLATSLRGQDYERYTVLVSDNASTDGTREHVLGLGDPRVRYVNTGQTFSMAQNYEFALEQVPERSGWVMLIGDDDGLLPGAIRRAADHIIHERPEAIRSVPCSYSWPSLTGHAWGRLGVPIGNGSRMIDARRALQRVIKGRSSYHELPMIYQGGVLPLPLLDQIKRVRGTFFQSCIPDVYSAMAVASVVQRYLLIDEPLGINGLSGHSIGMSQGRDRFRPGTPARKFVAENSIPFHPDVPLRPDGDYPVGQAIVYEPFLQSAFLRNGRPLTSHADQLVVVLTQVTEGNADLVRPWAATFANKHKLDLDHAERKARILRPIVRLRRTRELLLNATRIYSLGSASKPISTVYEASLEAAVVRRTISRRVELLPHLATKLLERLR